MAKKTPAARKKAPARKPAKAEQPSPPPVQVAARGVLLSIRQASEEFECDRTALTKKIRDAGLLPFSDEQYRLRDLLRVHRAGADGKADPDKMTPFERQAHYRAEAERMKLDVERGHLLRSADVEVEWARILKTIAHELDLIVDEIERDVGASPAVLEKIEAKLDAIRQRMYDRIVDDSVPAAA